MGREIVDILVIKARKRDKEAFSELIRQCTPELYKVGLAILMNDEDVADAIQDTILTCWEKIDTLKEVSFFKTWLIRIMINYCYSILNKRKKETDITEWEEPVHYDECNLELKEALNSIDKKYRLVIVLYYCEQYEVKEIADLLSIPKSTVTTRLQRGREKLAEYYAKCQ